LLRGPVTVALVPGTSNSEHSTFEQDENGGYVIMTVHQFKELTEPIDE
jgi:hypothetical protein